VKKRKKRPDGILEGLHIHIHKNIHKHTYKHTVPVTGEHKFDGSLERFGHGDLSFILFLFYFQINKKKTRKDLVTVTCHS